jgi:mannose-1-phosphate guanylyltransferase
MNAHHLVPELERLLAGVDGIERLVEEPTIRGTAGGVAGARAVLERRAVLVTNADVLAAVDGHAVLGATPADGLCLAVAPRVRGEGTVGVGADGAVVRLRGQSFGEEAAGGDYVCTMGIGAALLARLPNEGCLIGDVALPLLRSGGTVVAIEAAAELTAPGDSLPDYLAANLAWLAARGLSSFVAPSAEVASGVAQSRAIVGAGARVVGAGALERVVVWPGAEAKAPLADAVVTPRRIVRVESGAP